MAEHILEYSRTSYSKDDFIKKMSKAGYETEWNDDKKNVVFTITPSILKGKKNKYRLSNLKKTFNIPKFEKEKLLENFSVNAEKEKNKNLKDIIKYMDIGELEVKEETKKVLTNTDNIEDKINQLNVEELEVRIEKEKLSTSKWEKKIEDFEIEL